MPSRIIFTRLSFLIFILSFIACGFWAIAMGQGVDYDLKNYHYYNPYALLHGRLGFDFWPAKEQTFLNPLIDVPFGFLTKYVKPVHVGFLLGGAQGLCFWAAFILAQYALIRETKAERLSLGLLSAFVGIYGVVFISELGTSFNDAFLSLFVMAGLTLVIRSLGFDKPIPLGVLFFSGMILGMGLGLKPTLIVYVAAFAIAILFLKTSRSQRFWGVVSNFSGVFLGAFLTAGFWMAELWNVYGNPIFPLMHKCFASSYSGIEKFSAWSHNYFPRGLAQVLFYPFYFARRQRNPACECLFRDGRLAVIYALFVVAFFVVLYRYFKKRICDEPRSAGEIQKFLLVFFLCAYIFWQMLFSVYRFAAPLELLSPLIVVLLLTFVMNFKVVRWILAALFFVAILISVKPPNYGRKAWGAQYINVDVPRVAGLESSIVVNVSSDSIAYLIPFFPPAVRFLRFYEKPGTLFSKEMAGIIQRHSGNFFLLSGKGAVSKKEKEILSFYGLCISMGKPRVIFSDLDKSLYLHSLEGLPSLQGAPNRNE